MRSEEAGSAADHARAHGRQRTPRTIPSSPPHALRAGPLRARLPAGYGASPASPGFTQGVAESILQAAPRSPAVAMLRERESIFRSTARRYSLCLDDADDAFQRAAEILLTKGPALPSPRLEAWMQVVTRREALAVRRARLRLTYRVRSVVQEPATLHEHGADPLDAVPAPGPEPLEHLVRRERMLAGLRALASLKPDERTALILQAQGHSYVEISEICGWTYTKVNRCLSEGRARLRRLTSVSD